MKNGCDCMKTQEMLEMVDEVDKAISTVLAGGQSYKIGSRELTRADLGALRELRKELQAEATEDPNGLFGNTVVAVFDGR